MGNLFIAAKTFTIVGVTSFFLLCTSGEATSYVSQTSGFTARNECAVPIVGSALVRAVRFQELVRQWKSTRRATSSITAMAMADPYQRIIGLGADAIPLIISQLASEGDEPDQWFWALRVLTGEDPVSEPDRGDFVKMAHSWIAWAEAEGYAG